MTDYAVLFARTTMERLKGELEVLARQVVRATTKAEREKIVREINGVRVRLNTARMVLDGDELVRVPVYLIRYSGDAPRSKMDEVETIWVDKVEAQKHLDHLNDGQPEVPWYMEQWVVQREWREAADATEE